MRRFLIILSCVIATIQVNAQDTTPNWDNQLFVGNKVGWGKDHWRATGELQFRLEDNMNSLERWFIEGVASNLPSKHWEISIPIRHSVLPEYKEWRVGLGLLYKQYPNDKIQIVYQLMYQMDSNPGEIKHGTRGVVFFNYKWKDNIIPSLVAGVFHTWSESYTGFQYLRGGGGLTYVFDFKHTLNFNYFLGAQDLGDKWVYQGVFFFQLIINLNKEYRFLPAKYIIF